MVTLPSSPPKQTKRSIFRVKVQMVQIVQMGNDLFRKKAEQMGQGYNT